MHRPFRTLLLLAAVAVPLAACGDDDEPEASDDTSAGSSDDTADSAATSSTPTAACTDALFDGEISRDAEGDHPEAAITGDDVVDAIAYSYAPGYYTIYVADHEIDRATFEAFDAGDFSTDNAVVAEPGGVVATIFIDSSQLDDEDAFGFDGAANASPIIDSGGGAQASTTNPFGTLIVLEVDDEHVCFDIDYVDDFQNLDGVVNAELWQSA